MVTCLYVGAGHRGLPEPMRYSTVVPGVPQGTELVLALLAGRFLRAGAGLGEHWFVDDGHTAIAPPVRDAFWKWCDENGHEAEGVTPLDPLFREFLDAMQTRASGRR